MVSVSVRYLFCRPKDQKMDSSFSRQRKPDMEKVSLFDWPIVLQYDVKVKYRLISRKFSGMKFSHPNVRTKSNECLYPFNKPIKSLYLIDPMYSLFSL